MASGGSVSKEDIKHDWYQTDGYVVVAVLIKNRKASDVIVKYSVDQVVVDVELGDGNGDGDANKYHLMVNLSHAIIPEKCSYKVMSTKIEIKLMKVDTIQWTSLEAKGKHDELKRIEVTPAESGASGIGSGPLRYPTSNPNQRDWDAIEREISTQLEQEKPSGDDGINLLFQKIYGEGNDEVKRAMNKSYLESGGTVLSTNWKEISKEKVPIKPPDGLEWKQWNTQQ